MFGSQSLGSSADAKRGYGLILKSRPDAVPDKATGAIYSIRHQEGVYE